MPNKQNCFLSLINFLFLLFFASFFNVSFPHLNETRSWNFCETITESHGSDLNDYWTFFCCSLARFKWRQKSPWSSNERQNSNERIRNSYLLWNWQPIFIEISFTWISHSQLKTSFNFNLSLNPDLYNNFNLHTFIEECWNGNCKFSFQNNPTRNYSTPTVFYVDDFHTLKFRKLVAFLELIALRSIYIWKC